MNKNNIQWIDVLQKEKKKKYFIDIMYKLNKMRSIEVIYPKKEDVFKAFLLTHFYNIKVVILGQDPYCFQNQADGLSFSVFIETKLPPSLRNIFKELKNDFNYKFSLRYGSLIGWAKQGVFLLNSILTVNHGIPGSHKFLGWEIFTDTVIKIINNFHIGIVFILWGKVANKKFIFIDEKKHFILRSSHPSPLSSNRGFFGCKHFSKTNFFLKKQGKKTINWFLGIK